MNLLDLMHTGELAYEKDRKKFVLLYPNKEHPKEIDSVSVDSLDELKPTVEEKKLNTIVCYENKYTGVSQEDINKLTALMHKRKKERKGCLVLRESSPLAAPYNPTHPYSDY